MKTTALPMQSTSQRLHLLIIAALLCAIGIMMPMFMPRVILGPMSFTLACHVPTFIAMFLSPVVAVAVCVGTAIGFFVSTSPIIALRAASHIVFAFVGAWILKKFPDLLNHPFSCILYGFGIAILHAVAEVAAVTPFFMAGALFKPEQLADGFLMSVLILVGCGTVLHSMIDYGIALIVRKPLKMSMTMLK